MGNDLSQVFLLEFQNAYKEDISTNTGSVGLLRNQASLGGRWGEQGGWGGVWECALILFRVICV